MVLGLGPTKTVAASSKTPCTVTGVHSLKDGAAADDDDDGMVFCVVRCVKSRGANLRALLRCLMMFSFHSFLSSCQFPRKAATTAGRRSSVPDHPPDIIFGLGFEGFGVAIGALEARYLLNIMTSYR